MSGQQIFASCLTTSLRGLLLLSLTILAGCGRQPEFNFTQRQQFTRGTGADTQILKLTPKMQEIVADEVTSLLGYSPKSLKMLGAEQFDKELFEETEDFDEFEDLRSSYLLRSWSGKFDSDHLEQGRIIYTRRCVQCHGETGDGNGEMAEHLYPRPRDYRRGIFKFISTTLKPLRSDLVRTVAEGVPGTSMPSFDRLNEKEVEAVVDYVIALTHRGELEYELSLILVNDLDLPEELEADATAEDQEEYKEDLADFEEELAEEKLDAIERILTAWTFDADDDELLLTSAMPLTLQPRFTPELIQQGKELFDKVGCTGCHDLTGRGLSKGFDKYDAWNMPTIAADLTSGMMHGGRRPEDIYRRFYVGIKGTPMPSVMQSKDMKAALEDNPEAVWSLVAYVLSLSEVRRSGTIPAAETMKGTTYEAALQKRGQGQQPAEKED